MPQFSRAQLNALQWAVLELIRKGYGAHGMTNLKELNEELESQIGASP